MGFLSKIFRKNKVKEWRKIRQIVKLDFFWTISDKCRIRCRWARIHREIRYLIILRTSNAILYFINKQRHNTGAALGRVHTGSVNPWISRIFAKHPMKFDIKSDPSIIVNPWIEIPNVVTEQNNFFAALESFTKYVYIFFQTFDHLPTLGQTTYTIFFVRNAWKFQLVGFFWIS